MAVFFRRKLARCFLVDDAGATAVEYALIVALMTIVIVGGLSALGGGASGMWGRLQTQIGNALR